MTRLFPRLAATAAVCVAVAAAGCHPQASAAPPVRTALHARVEGRAVVEAPLTDGAGREATSVRLAYSLSRVSARFRGPDVAVDLEDLGEPDPHKLGTHVAVEIDGEPLRPLVLERGRRRCYVLARGLSGGAGTAHVVRLTKRTEVVVGGMRFFGVHAPGGLLEPPLPATRRIWLLGDSITCGYGNTGRGPHCKFAAESEDATLAYSGRLAYALGASVEAVAYSGRGLWRNLDGSHQDTVPALFERVLPDAPNLPFRPAAPPHAVVVNLGTNDAFAKGPLEARGLTEAWVRLLARLRALAPQAPIFVALGPMLTNTWAEHPMALRHVAWAINDALAARAAAGDRNVTLVGLTEQDGKLGYGCDYHPSLATHALMAQHLADVVAERLHWTQHPVLGRLPQLF